MTLNLSFLVTTRHFQLSALIQKRSFFLQWYEVGSQYHLCQFIFNINFAFLKTWNMYYLKAKKNITTILIVEFVAMLPTFILWEHYVLTSLAKCFPDQIFQSRGLPFLLVQKLFFQACYKRYKKIRVSEWIPTIFHR